MLPSEGGDLKKCEDVGLHPIWPRRKSNGGLPFLKWHIILCFTVWSCDLEWDSNDLYCLWADFSQPRAWVSVKLLSEALIFTCLSESSRPCRTRWFIFRHMCPRFCSEFSTSISWLLLDMLAPISSALCTHISTALCALHAKPHTGRGHVQQPSLAVPGTGCRGDSGPGLSYAAVLRDEAENIFPKSRKEREGSF